MKLVDGMCPVDGIKYRFVVIKTPDIFDAALDRILKPSLTAAEVLQLLDLSVRLT